LDTNRAPPKAALSSRAPVSESEWRESLFESQLRETREYFPDALHALCFWGRMASSASRPSAAMGALPENLSLDQIEPGEKIVLRAFHGDRELQSRLMLLGLFVGAAADVIQTRKRGPTLIRVRNTLVAIGYEEAKTILVDVSR
jgi:Fe2+ transport system protein FeoA